MSSTYRFTSWDKGVAVLFICDVLVLSSSWRLVFDDILVRGAYVLLIHATLVFGFVYALLRSRKIGATWPWRAFFLMGIIVTGLNLVPRVMFFGLPVRSVIGTPYISTDDAEDKVLWIHNHGYLSNSNALVRVIQFPRWPFWLETPFEESDLNGTWRKYSMDNEAYEGTYRYADGEIVEVIDP